MQKYAITVVKDHVAITLLVTNDSRWFAVNEVIRKLRTLGIEINDGHITKVENIEEA